jgi:hypothetical protein
MNRKTLLIAGGALVVAAFLLGFVPQYLKTRDLGNQLDALRQQLNSEREKSQMDELALLCGYAYLETNLKNYGLASQDATKFFDRVRAMTIQGPNSGRQAFLQAALAQRDLVIGGLAKGDSGTASAVQDLFQSALEMAQIGSK